jgi:hypothetical protein
LDATVSLQEGLGRLWTWIQAHRELFERGRVEPRVTERVPAGAARGFLAEGLA